MYTLSLFRALVELASISGQFSTFCRLRRAIHKRDAIVAAKRDFDRAVNRLTRKQRGAHMTIPAAIIRGLPRRDNSPIRAQHRVFADTSRRQISRVSFRTGRISSVHKGLCLTVLFPVTIARNACRTRAHVCLCNCEAGPSGGRTFCLEII